MDRLSVSCSQIEASDLVLRSERNKTTLILHESGVSPSFVTHIVRYDHE
jgi:hypothetical protein